MTWAKCAPSRGSVRTAEPPDTWPDRRNKENRGPVLPGLRFTCAGVDC